MGDLIDFETFVVVRRLAPVVMEPSEYMVKTLLAALAGIGVAQKPEMDVNANAFWFAGLKDLQHWFAEGIKCHQIGRTCRDLGLKMRRVGSGYQVLWNREQLDVLNANLGV